MIQPVGYFKLWRELFTKPIWLNSTPEQKVVLVTIMAMANFKENEWEWSGNKFSLKPGQFITSLESIVKQSGKGITIQNVRTALTRFEKLEFLTNESTKTGRLITVLNWELYQAQEEKLTNQLTDSQQRPNKELTDSQQRPNKELTSKEEGNKTKKVKKVKNDIEGQEDINTIFDHYCEVFAGYYQTISLTPTRMKCIGARLKRYTVDQIKLAISNIRTSKYHLGEDANNDKFYATLEFICRNDETVEKWINHVPKKSTNANTNKALELYQKALEEERGGEC